MAAYRPLPAFLRGFSDPILAFNDPDGKLELLRFARCKHDQLSAFTRGSAALRQAVRRL